MSLNFFKSLESAVDDSGQLFGDFKTDELYCGLFSVAKFLQVVGPMANDATQLFGDYAPEPPPEDVTTPLEGLRPISQTVRYTSGCDDTNCKNYNAAEVLKVITSNNDINFVALGTGENKGSVC